MSEEKISDLDWLAQQVKYDGALLKYNQILTLLALDNKDDDMVTFLLDGLFCSLTSFLRYEEKLVDCKIMGFHRILEDTYFCNDPKFFIEKVPESRNYLRAYMNLEFKADETVDYQLAQHKQRLKKNPILASS
jgi:hypothetical protein